MHGVDDARGHHDPDGARRAERRDEIGERVVPRAPSFASAFTASGERSNATHSWPPRCSRRTMLAPMRPSPIIPSCIACSAIRLSSALA